ncbi:MAG: hypothetical protein OXC48_08345, partial [Endozoicomonadaceae bacterium]|nr:hypothetical protein [Endozoicomonadaceae bacterium]
MKINRFDSVHSANSYQSKPLLQSVAQTKLSAQSVVSDKLSMLSNHIEVGLYLAMTLSDLFTNSDAYFNTVTKRMEENKKKYDELSALVKPVDVVVDKVAKLAIDHAGDPKFADPTLTPIKIYTINIDNNVTEYFPFNTPPDPDYPYGRVFETRQTEKIRTVMGNVYRALDYENPANIDSYERDIGVTGYSPATDYSVYNSYPGCYIDSDTCKLLPVLNYPSTWKCKPRGSTTNFKGYTKHNIPASSDSLISIKYIGHPINILLHNVPNHFVLANK